MSCSVRMTVSPFAWEEVTFFTDGNAALTVSFHCLIHMCLAHSALHAIHFYHNFFHCCSSSVLLLSAYILYQLHPFLRMYCKKLLMLHVQFMQYRVRKMPVITRPVFFSHL